MATLVVPIQGSSGSTVCSFALLSCNSTLISGCLLTWDPDPNPGNHVLTEARFSGYGARQIGTVQLRCGHTKNDT